jgi:hypothetical protein
MTENQTRKKSWWRRMDGLRKLKIKIEYINRIRNYGVRPDTKGVVAKSSWRRWF